MRYNELVINKRNAQRAERDKEMMYSEFVAGTGCRENDHNYKLFKRLEVMYMNTDMSKEEVYEYGKKLADNSKSEAELRAEARIKEDIEEFKREIELSKEDIERYTYYLGIFDSKEDQTWYKGLIKKRKAEIKDLKSRIGFLKLALN